MLANVGARGNEMKKTYAKPTLLKREKLSAVTAGSCTSICI
jgi:hypothetical protein